MAPKQNYNKANYQKNTNLVQTGPAMAAARVTRTKTDGRIGSATPPALLKGGLSVDNNRKAGPAAGIGALAAKHMSPDHAGGNSWSPRVAKARSMATPNGKAYANPVNAARPTLKRAKPD